MVSRPLHVSLASLALVPFLSAQQQHYELYGDGQTDRFGSSVATGDVDGDGFSDLLVGAPLDDEGGFSMGSAKVFSGLTGQLLRSHFGTQPTSNFGDSVALADVDGDGLADPIVGDPWFEVGGNRQGRVTVYSGLDGSVIHAIDGLVPFDDFGRSVARVGDVNGDGREEFVVGAPFDDRGGSAAGAATLFDGATGTVLRTTFGPAAGAELGAAVAGAGDVDADGTPDFVVGLTGDTTNGNRSGAMYAVSGRTGVVLRAHFGPAAGDYLGASVAGGGDVDGDGFDDLIVGATQFPLGPGYAEVVSGRTGAVLYHKTRGGAACLYGSAVSIVGDANGDGRAEFAAGFVGFCQGLHLFDGASGALLLDDQPPFGPISGYGSVLAAAADVNGDAVPDFVTGAAASNHLVLNGGSVHVLSARALPLWTDRHEVSAPAGGSQTLNLDAGPALGGSLYWVLGSASGIAPGLPLGGVVLPLNVPDGYFDLTINQPNGALLPGSLGTLDGNGRAQAAFVLPPASTALVGTSVHHAYLVFDLAPLDFRFASNATPVTAVN